MPLKLSDEELKQKRERILSLNETGQGLNNPNTRYKLQNLQYFFSWAADGLEKELAQNGGGTRKQKELALYLKKAGEAFRNLRDPNVLNEGENQLEADKNSKFEESIRLLGDLPKVLLDRDENGDLLFSHVERHGAPTQGADYRRGNLLSDLAGLDPMLGLDFAPAMEKVDSEMSPQKKAEYMETAPVRNFKQDPDARLAASLLDPGSEASGALTDLISVTNAFQERNVPLVRNARALQQTAMKASQTTDPNARRAAILQMTQQIKMVRELYQNRSFYDGEINLYGERKNVVFPPDPEKLNLEHADLVLNKYFDEKDPRVRDQIRANTSAAPFRVAEGDSGLRTLLHLIPEKDGKTNAVTADFAMLQGAAKLLTDKWNKMNDGPEHGTEAEDALYYVATNLNNIVRFYEEQVDGADKSTEWMGQQTKTLNLLFQEVNQNLDRFYAAAKPEDAEYVRNALQPLQNRMPNMDLNEIPEAYKKEDLGPAPAPKSWEKPMPQDEALVDFAKQDNAAFRGYSPRELRDTRANEIMDMFRRLGNSSEFDYVLDARANMSKDYGYRGDKLAGSGIPPALQEEADRALVLMERTCRNVIDNFRNGNQPGKNYTAFYAENDLESLRNHAETFKLLGKKAEQLEGANKEFSEACKTLANSITECIDNALEPKQEDALRSYIAFNSGRHVGSGEQNKLICAAKVAAAYQWAEEHNYKPGDPIDRKQIEENAKEVLKDPTFREFFRQKNAQPSAAQKNPIDQLALNKAVLQARPQDLVNTMRDPLVYGSTREEKLSALKALRDLGDVLDHCSGASKKYKQFYHSLKDLSLLDMDKMSNEELGKKIQDIYNKTEQYMKGNKSVSWFKVRREHFEQALDALACINKCGPYAKRLTQKLVDRTNFVRKDRFRKQPEVSLEGRNAEKTAERLARCRGVVATEQSNDIIALAEKQLKENKLIRASEAKNAASLPALPKDVKQTVKLSDQMEQIRKFLKSSEYNYSGSSARVPEMLALTITPAYRKDGEIVLDQTQYERNVRVMKQHLASNELVKEYSEADKRTALQAHENPNKCGQLRLEFNEKAQKLSAEIAAKDRHERGNVWNMTDKEEREMLRQNHLKLTKELSELTQNQREERKLQDMKKKVGMEFKQAPAAPEQTNKHRESETLQKMREELGFDRKGAKPQATAEELKAGAKELAESQKGLGM